MADEADPQGMRRPNIPTKKAADKNADRQRIATKKGSKGDRPSIPTKKSPYGDRPVIPTKKEDRQERPLIPTKKTPPTGPPNFDPPTGPSVSPKGMQRRGGYAQEFPQSRRMLPSIHTKSRLPNIAVGEGNDPKGMQRPDTTGY